MSSNKTFSLEAIAERSINYYEKLVDKDGLPYFNVFCTEPCEAAHDWPDAGDVISRQWQGAIMLRQMTGKEAATEKVWRKKILGMISPKDGLLYRPRFDSENKAAPGETEPGVYSADAALPLYALITAYLADGDEESGRMARLMADTLLDRSRKGLHPRTELGEDIDEIDGFLLKAVMACARHLGSASALELARIIVRKLFIDKPAFTPDNQLPEMAHMHGSLRSLLGACDYALYINDPILYSRIDALYRYVRSTGTRFGFIPEMTARKGDIVSCETCALMDYAGLGVSLANHGHPEYWDDMDRLMRNQLAESQLIDTGWLHSSANPSPDDHQFTWRDIGSRCVGAYAGWSSPTHILAAKEQMPWGGPELKNKPRALQNCCGGSGVHALFILWKNATSFERGVLSVNLHLDKDIPQALIRSYQPHLGRLAITLQADCTLRVRIPDFVPPNTLKATVGSAAVQPKLFGNYAEFPKLKSGDEVELLFPLPMVTEEISIGNPGYRQYRYRVTWKGSTVIKMEPLGEEVTKGFSDFDRREVEIYYGESGPGRLYQRDQWAADSIPAESTLHPDDGSINFWKFSDSVSG